MLIVQLALSEPFEACAPPRNPEQLAGKIAIVKRGGCMFVEKTRYLEDVGVKGVIVIGRLLPFDSCSLVSCHRKIAVNLLIHLFSQCYVHVCVFVNDLDI